VGEARKGENSAALGAGSAMCSKGPRAHAQHEHRPTKSGGRARKGDVTVRFLRPMPIRGAFDRLMGGRASSGVRKGGVIADGGVAPGMLFFSKGAGILVKTGRKVDSASMGRTRGMKGTYQRGGGGADRRESPRGTEDRHQGGQSNCPPSG